MCPPGVVWASHGFYNISKLYLVYRLNFWGGVCRKCLCSDLGPCYGETFGSLLGQVRVNPRIRISVRFYQVFKVGD